jgi:hypothetical protein
VVDEQPAATIAHVMAATLANIRVMDMV